MKSPLPSSSVPEITEAAGLSYQSLLFHHLNSYWLYKLLAKKESGILTNPLLLQSKWIDKLTSFGSASDFTEGYLLGEAIFSHYRESGFPGLPDTSFITKLEGLYPGYTHYLGSRIYAWAVPLSYREYDRFLTDPDASPVFDKRLNLQGSTIAHKSYFKKLLPKVAAHIRSLAPRERPAGFVDIGCGDGELLRSLRKELGSLAGDFQYVGVDIDELSIEVARESATEDTFFMIGDVSDPDHINEFLIERHLPSLDHFFHLRAFVDHNFNPAAVPRLAHGREEYLYRKGVGFLSRTSVLTSYLTHFRQWKKYISRHGIGLIELHTTHGKSLAESPSVAYEIFHILSGQYVVDYADFEQLIKEAGWKVKETVSLVPKPTPSVSIGIYH